MVKQTTSKANLPGGNERASNEQNLESISHVIDPTTFVVYHNTLGLTVRSLSIDTKSSGKVDDHIPVQSSIGEVCGWTSNIVHDSTVEVRQSMRMDKQLLPRLHCWRSSDRNSLSQFIISRRLWSSGYISPGSKGWLDSCIRLWSMTNSWGSVIISLNRLSTSPLKAFILCDTSSKFPTTILGSPGYICGSFTNPWTLLLR